MRIVVFNRAEVENTLVSGKIAYISLRDSDQAEARLPSEANSVGILRLAFDDVLDGAERGRDITAFNVFHAGQILDFWNSVKDDIETLVVHCNGGQCRSPAVAAAIERIETGQDEHWFKTKRPNILVYRTLLEEYHNRLDSENNQESAFGPVTR
jgi:predicted protein tyrosine phosphatase